MRIAFACAGLDASLCSAACLHVTDSMVTSGNVATMAPFRVSPAHPLMRQKHLRATLNR